MKARAILLAIAATTSTASLAQGFDPAPWLADLEQARQTFHSRYANLEWLEGEREVNVDAMFDELAKRLEAAPDEQAAKAVFERLERRVGDGHVGFEWPAPARPAATPAAGPAPQPDLCARIGYDARQNGPGTADKLAGYQPLSSGDGNPFAAGIVASAGAQVGVVRIGVFQPQGYPMLCEAAVRALAIPADRPCDDECQNRITTWAYRRMGESLEQRIAQLKTAGTEVMLVDISRNGGGSEWAEAAARMFSAKQLVSARMGFVRGEHWAKQWRDLAANLRGHAARASPEDRQRLLGWAAQADSARRVAQTPCPPGSTACRNVAMAGFSTGLVGTARAGSFAGKDWGVYVFNPAQHHYRDGIWTGPLIVLTDQETWSAAEQFAALLQDNRAAAVLGARTGGAGCGHTWGGHPTTLKNSGAVLKLPDCVRYRRDGSNEVRGIIPDVLTGAKATDGAGLRARLTAEHLPAAIAKARALKPGRQ